MSKKLAQIKLRSETQAKRVGARSTQPTAYDAFDKIDGRHAWQNEVPDGFVLYPVRKLERGKVTYFNFSLARELGIIPANHADEMTPQLTDKIIETFSIQIINEYDQAAGFKPPKESLKTHPYMATRYLQLQHANKQGKTSGDGRSIWNGQIRHRGKTWDISSRGTGVTCLSPGSAEANKPLKTGEGTYGYGCGLADVTELMGSAVMSEIFHLNGIGTERVLTIIDLGKGCGIGVRAAPCLVRPAHLFLYLKQGRVEELRQATDFLIRRQYENDEWNIDPSASDRYQKMLKALSESFAKFTARLEREYVFAWLDWDGDNVLATAGIIDYGSIRQFGLRHDQYRYDDVQRFSTNLNEQRGKARLSVQVFAQLVAMLETGRRRPLEEFASHSSVRDFDRVFDHELRRIFLTQIGLTAAQCDSLLKEKRKDVERLYCAFLALEKCKTRGRIEKLPDGVNRPAIFNMRKALRTLPELASSKLLDKKSMPIDSEEFFKLILATKTKRIDRKLTASVRKDINTFLSAYLHVVQSVLAESDNSTAALRLIVESAAEQNRAARITGNGSEFIVDEILKAKKRGLESAQIQSAIDLFITSQAPSSARRGRKAKPVTTQSGAGALLQELIRIAKEFEEDV